MNDGADGPGSSLGTRASAHGRNDARPEYRIAVFGLAGRFQRLLEIVLKHARNNRYRYALAAERRAGSFDIAIVDMTAKGGPEVATTLQRILNGRPVIKVGRRNDDSRPRDDLLQSLFTARVIYALNEFVDRHLFRSPAVMAERPARHAHAVDEAGALRRPRALIVDDSPTVRRQLSVALNQMGMDTEAVASAQEALDVVARRRYELAFVDVVMPEIDGYRLTRAIKKNRDLRTMPVIILTSRSSPFDLARGALAGCNSYLVKPVSMQSLRDTVNRQLRKSLASTRVRQTLRPA